MIRCPAVAPYLTSLLRAGKDSICGDRRRHINGLQGTLSECENMPSKAAHLAEQGPKLPDYALLRNVRL